MLECFEVRTDLALEAKESFENEAKIRGVRVTQNIDEELEIETTIVKIETENGARAMRKPVGTYITLEAPNMSAQDAGYHREISKVLAGHVRALLPKKGRQILVVGLGNREITPDALGPEVVGNLRITRHLMKEYGQQFSENVRSVSAVVPGVMAQTGMESLEMIQAIVKKIKPDVVVAVDALAARSVRRLNRTIQITDTGIQPGSGVGNRRNEVDAHTLGVPVIAVGIPTVVDAGTIIRDAIGNFFEEAMTKPTSKTYISPQLNTMFVTPKDIDETIRRISFTVSEGLNIAFSDPE